MLSAVSESSPLYYLFWILPRQEVFVLIHTLRRIASNHASDEDLPFANPRLTNGLFALPLAFGVAAPYRIA